MEQNWTDYQRENTKTSKSIETLASIVENLQKNMETQQKQAAEDISDIREVVLKLAKTVDKMRLELNEGKVSQSSSSGGSESMEEADVAQSDDEYEDDEEMLNSTFATQASRPKGSLITTLTTLKRTATAPPSPTRLSMTQKGRKSGRER